MVLKEARGSGTYNGKRSVILVIQRQPGVNVIDTVERIKAALSGLRAAIPPGIDVDIVIDRTRTIRASVNDVQFTLILTIALVVLVSFLFLRNLHRRVNQTPWRGRIAGGSPSSLILMATALRPAIS
jgi:multidrug efflux pump subunit AcrB